MLIELTIENIALIQSLRIDFSQGFNVLTGETGAGKSIVVDSVNLALGGRAERDLIRTGSEKASVQALFDISACPKAISAVAELGVDCEDGMIALRRELSRSGRNICRISGVIVPLTTLRAVAELLMDVHGQHEHQSLLNPAAHMGYLDGYGGADHLALKAQVSALYAERSATASKLRAVLKDAAERERLLDVLSLQVQEIEAARLKPGEEEKLAKKAAMLDNAQRIRDGVDEAYALAYGEGRQEGAQELLSRAAAAMENIANLDERFSALAEKLREVYYLAQDAGYELQHLREELTFDPEMAEKIARRLETIDRLERKYGATIEDVLAFGQDARNRLDQLNASEENIDSLKKELRVRDNSLKEACTRLTESRNALAKRLTQGILEQLADLGMGKTRLEIRLVQLPKPTRDGMDGVEILISPNPGEPLKPLTSVASGGELSRIMLALKAVAMDADGVETMVFDEIDTGVSGRMAQVVGEKMRMIARNRQVLCVTHLPQIAALGQHHFLVEKTSDGQRTDSTVRQLDFEGRIREIARLVGGAEDCESARQHARRMLLAAENVPVKHENA